MDARLRLLLWVVLAFGPAPAMTQGFDHAHRDWDALLKKHVVLVAGGKTSQMNYAGMLKDREALKAYLARLSSVSEADFTGWSKPQRMAFLINAYNAFTVELILAHYPVKSIRDIGGVLDNRWRRKFFALFGRPSYLDEIEHEVLRKPGNYDEPRVHYALNCASIGCPMLREEAFVAERLEAQLEQQAMRFLSDRTRNRYADGRLEVSMIFSWFKEDFGARERYFAKYARLLADHPEHRKRVADGKAPIAHLDYDWTLNDLRK